MQLSFDEAVEELCSRSDRYKQDAYVLLRDSFDATLKQTEKANTEGNLSAAELYHGYCAYAVAQFGPLAEDVLYSWGVSSPEDVGELVYNLIEMGIFGSRKEDSKVDFAELPPMADILEGLFLEQANKLSVI